MSERTDPLRVLVSRIFNAGYDLCDGTNRPGETVPEALDRYTQAIRDLNNPQ